VIQQQKIDSRNSTKGRVYCQMLW